ncbi:MAG: class I SAM-dependent methyltransferase [Polyangiales bacterium]
MYPTTYQSGESAVNWSGVVDMLSAHVAAPARVLDYGCGNGAFTEVARAAGYEAEGAEFNPAYVAMLRNRLGGTFHTIEDLPGVPAASYDALLMSNVLEHLRAPRETARGLLRLLKPGGVLFAFGPLESNFTLAGGAIELNMVSKALLMPGRADSHPPFHLSSTTYDSQREFFRRLGLQELEYRVEDSAFPFPLRLRDVDSAKGAIQWAIGAVSRLISERFPRMGNTFFYFGRVT